MSFSQLFERALNLFIDSKGSYCIKFRACALQEAVLSLEIVFYYYGCDQKIKQKIERVAYLAMKLGVIFIKIYMFSELLVK
jgi:hypothetical protein